MFDELADADTSLIIDMPAVSAQLMSYCESLGLGRVGVDLHAHDWPDEEKTKSPKTVLFIDTSPGILHGLIQGAVTCHTEYIAVQSRAKNEDESRKMLVPFANALHDVKKQIIGKVYYMNVQAVIPIHFVGTDKNNRYVQELIFKVMRRPAD
jgi:hypothetical protein